MWNLDQDILGSAAFDQNLHYLLKLQEKGSVKQTFSPRSGPFSKPIIRANRPTSALSVLIFFTDHSRVVDGSSVVHSLWGIVTVRFFLFCVVLVGPVGLL